MARFQLPKAEVRIHAPEEILLAENTLIDVSGSHGGQVYIGGEKQGSPGAFFTSQRTTAAEGAWIYADGLDSDAGQVICWADETMRFDGQISAQGLGGSGDGGFAEVSGHELFITGHANLLSQRGNAGTFLLDPGTITVTHSAVAAGPNIFGDTFINGQLALGNFTLDTAVAPGGGAQTVTFDTSGIVISWSTAFYYRQWRAKPLLLLRRDSSPYYQHNTSNFTAINWSANPGGLTAGSFTRCVLTKV